MNRVPHVLIVAEVGKRVGWGHVARSSLLRNLLSDEFPVTLKIVNREVWDDDLLENKYALNNSIDADIVFFDGLSLSADAEPLINARTTVSLSYVSDINSKVDYVVAPALHGMDAPSNYITDLSAILCNRPIESRITKEKTVMEGEKARVGICMGGSDVDGITPDIETTLKARGFQTRVHTSNNNQEMSLTEFLKKKLENNNTDTFPHYDMVDCDMVVCQGGLSAVEFALLGIPTVIRRRPDFADAYRFLETIGCTFPSKRDDISSLASQVTSLSSDTLLLDQMSKAGKTLLDEMNGTFWLSFVNNIIGR